MWDQLQHYFGQLPDFIWNIFLTISALTIGLTCKLLLGLYIRRSTKSADYSLLRSFILRLGPPATLLLPLLTFNMLLESMRMKRAYFKMLDKTTEIALTISVALVLIGIIKVIEDYVYYAYNFNKIDNLRERKIRTQLQFLRKFAIGLIVFLTSCAILLSFEKLRKVGAGLLTGVGVGGIIIGFAAQRSLANLLAGFQIAFTQPIRIDDVIVVEGEWGKVEEITLTYVVVLIWDQRRLILPINYFIEKPFQNWTRTGSELLGAVFLYLDYTVPVEAIRNEFNRFLNGHPLWDNRVGVIQVTNATENTLEIRALVSAGSSSKAFDLRCETRENLIAFIQKNYPESLPKKRVEMNGAAAAADNSAKTDPGVYLSGTE